MERRKPIFIAGPCVIESREVMEHTAQTIVEIATRLGVEIYFKASFDKANRTSLNSYRGVGIERGIALLDEIKQRYNLPIITDIHEAWQADVVSPVADIIQIPALLSRQTDLIVAAARSQRIVNIKKGQFLSGLDMRHPYLKAMESGAKEVWLTERGNTFGYNNLVVDFRNIADMHTFAPTVIMDCTHSVQRPGGGEGRSSGNREFIPTMAEAAKAFGCDGYFFEVHPAPEQALCDGDNSLHINDLENTITKLL
ncbi:MAG: 3-deoxy-8-phosphooctulonate synthase [Alistipes sp.]|nr:3-deoxy-8-phosphooctulonate synthase [Alistipes sp.]